MISAEALLYLWLSLWAERNGTEGNTPTVQSLLQLLRPVDEDEGDGEGTRVSDPGSRGATSALGSQLESLGLDPNVLAELAPDIRAWRALGRLYAGERDHTPPSHSL